ncbi:MAG: hydroxyphenylacetyl-CoA thioesterase PaaI [Bacteroidetes bacterium]|nr:hydroxyphenylacetyl-CoA thioesterase PaaI [Bacteroidota bacterium]
MKEAINITPQQAVAKMLANDKFTAWLGIEIEKVDLGYCKLRYAVKGDMLNGFGIIHGGVLFAASDSAFAFACNTHGYVTVALEVSISFTRPATAGEVLTVEAKEIHMGNKTGVYEIRTTNEKGELLSLFKGTAYRTSKQIEPLL